MTRPRTKRWRLFLALASAIVLAGCGDTRPCKPGTLFLTVDFQGTARDADQLLVAVTPEGETARQNTFSHAAGTATGTVEVDFPGGYQAGTAVQLVLTAQKAGAGIIATASPSVVLTDGCSTLRIQIAGTGQDGGDFDAPAGGTGGGPGAGGGSGTGGGSGAGGGPGTAGGSGTDGGSGAGGTSDSGVDGSASGGRGGASDGGSDTRFDGNCAPVEDCYNGVDDDCDGHIDCDDPACGPAAVCVPAAGANGFVPGAYVDPVTACPAGFAAGETAINATLVPGAGCRGCSCRASITCTTNLSKYANALACTLAGATTLAGSIRSDYATGAAAPTNTCLASTFTMANAPAIAAYVTLNSPCTAQGTGAPPTPTWATARKFCGAGSVGGGCGAGFICVPRSSANHCVLTAGVRACPAGYNKDPGPWYTGFNDARTCSACACGAQTPGSCASLRASFYAGSTTCTTAVQFSGGSASSICTFGTDCQSAGFGGTPTLPSCPASSTLTGTVTATGEQTLCCAP